MSTSQVLLRLFGDLCYSCLVLGTHSWPRGLVKFYYEWHYSDTTPHLLIEQSHLVVANPVEFQFFIYHAQIDDLALCYCFREIWLLSKSAFSEKKMDIHTKLMRRYKQVPEWWFTCILLVNIMATIFTCQYFKDQLQLPWWGVLLACALALFFTLPIGVITATTNQVQIHHV